MGPEKKCGILEGGGGGVSGTLVGHSNQLSYLRVPTNHHLQTLQPYSIKFLQNFYLNYEVKVSCPNIAGNKVKCSWGQNLQNTILGAWLVWRQVKIPELCKTSPYRQAKTRSCRGQTRFLLGQDKKYHIQLTTCSLECITKNNFLISQP